MKNLELKSLLLKSDEPTCTFDNEQITIELAIEKLNFVTVTYSEAYGYYTIYSNYKNLKLQSTINLNKLKLSAIKNGGYDKHKKIILEACSLHLQLYGDDLTPNQF